MTDFDWGTDAPPQTTKKIEELWEDLLSTRETITQIEEGLKALSEKKTQLEGQIVGLMKDAGISHLKGKNGSLGLTTRRSVAQPETMEQKMQFFDFLREKGIFEEMVSVNSRTLSSFVTAEIEAKEKEGVFGWVPPGLKEPNITQVLSVRKK